MKFRKSISVILLAAILCSTAACADSGEKPEDTAGSSTSAGDTETATGTETGRESVSDDLPTVDYGGAEFTIMDRTKYVYEFTAEEENGDILNDAVHERNRKVEDRFNVKIGTYTMDCDWGSSAKQFNNTLRASIQAGDSAFDLVAAYAAAIPGVVSDGIFMNWNDLKYNDFSKPWWSKTVADELTINGKAFMMTGDLSLSLWKEMFCFYFNKRLADNYNLGDIYGLVKNGEWTLDKLAELTKGIYEDADGDGTASFGDRYGFLLGYDTVIDTFKEAFEVHVTEKDKDGFPKIVFNSDSAVEAVEKLNSYIHSEDSVFFPQDGSDEVRMKLMNMFSSGLGVFYAQTLGISEDLRSMDDDFGIIPYPKYDTTQDTYHSTARDNFSMFVVPVDVKDPDMTSVITEALCAESYKIVVPTFYDKALKTKAARDDDSAEMIDMIRDGLVFDWGYLHSDTLGGVGHIFVGLIRNNSNNVMSEYAKKQDKYATNLEKVLEVYR